MPERLRSLPGPRRALAALLALLVVLTVAFIWSNSLKNPEASMRQSALAERVVRPVILAIPLAQLHTPEMVSLLTRKLGHFAEFFLLSVLLMALSVALRSALALPAWGLFLFALAVAAADEGLQFFSDRVPRVADVLLDGAGALAGLGTAWLFERLYRSRRAAAGGRRGHV